MAPVNTRTVRIRLLSISNSGSSVDAYFDDVSFSSIITLPIELLNFDVEENNNQVYFNWTTGSEINNNYFTLERSNNDVRWETVTYIAGQGSTADVTDYTFETEYNADQKYYRLKQTDYDGTYTYSKTVIAQQKSPESTYKSYPSAMNGILNIEGDFNIDDFGLFNSKGEVVTNLNNVSSQSGLTIIDVSGLQKGMYIIRINNFTQKVFKM